jgi:hypothetical protein
MSHGEPQASRGPISIPLLTWLIRNSPTIPPPNALAIPRPMVTAHIMGPTLRNHAKNIFMLARPAEHSPSVLVARLPQGTRRQEGRPAAAEERRAEDPHNGEEQACHQVGMVLQKGAHPDPHSRGRGRCPPLAARPRAKAW